MQRRFVVEIIRDVSDLQVQVQICRWSSYKGGRFNKFNRIEMRNFATN